MLTTYRIAYGLILTAFLVNVLKASNFSVWPMHVSVLLVVAALTLCGVLVLLVGFSRMPMRPFWVFVAAWELLFVWYAWFSPASPFALHELHTLDPAAMAQESTRHYLRAGALFAVLFAWFVSLPVVRRLSRNSAHLAPR